MHQYGFEKLHVWQNARELTISIYLLTNKFPKSEQFGLTSQMRRAAVSISSNIAEGSSKSTRRGQAAYYNIAYSSTMELISQLILASDLGYISAEDLSSTRKKMEVITIQLNALNNSIKRTPNH